MLAISLHQPWASAIFFLEEDRGALFSFDITAQKTIETRRWETKHRGELLIVSTKTPVVPGLPSGTALGVVEVADCRILTLEDTEQSQCPYVPGLYAWVLKNIRPIVPFQVNGRQGFYQIKATIKFKKERR